MDRIGVWVVNRKGRQGLRKGRKGAEALNIQHPTRNVQCPSEMRFGELRLGMFSQRRRGAGACFGFFDRIDRIDRIGVWVVNRKGR